METRGGLPFLVVEGSHREVGLQVGMATAAVCRDAVAFDDALPAGRSRAEQLALAARYRDVTLAATPWLVDEIDGAAEGADVDPLALFAASIEEIWTVRPSQATAGETVDGGCSDLVAAPPAKRMRRFEGDSEYALRSAVRLRRALELLDGPAGEGPAPGSIGPDQLAAFLSDHATSPAICRHDDGTERSVTVFWCLADVTAGEIRYGRGPRCRGEEATYRFR